MGLPDIAEGELQVLQSIFSDSEIVLDQADHLHLLLLPEPLEPLTSSENQVAVRLSVTFPDDYPNESPAVQIEYKKNIDSERLEGLKEVIDSLLLSHRGFECLFDLHSEITCWLQSNNTALKSLHQAIAATQAAENAEDSAEELSESESETAGRLADKNLVTEDCRATEEQFAAWKRAFKLEMVAAGIWKDLDAEDERPTGKALFTSGLLKSKDNLIANEAATTAAQTSAPFWQNNELFNAENDLDPDLLEGDLSEELSGAD